MYSFRKFLPAIVLFSGLQLISTTTFAQSDTASLNLQQVWELVAANSKKVQVADKSILQHKVLLQDAKNSQLPTLGVFGEVDKASNMPVYSSGLFHKPEQHDVVHTLYQTGANAYLNLYNGFKTKNEIKLAKAELRLSEAEMSEVLAEQKKLAAQYFYDLHLQYQLMEVLQADIKEKEHELEEIKNFHQAGVVLASDVLRAELELSKRKMTLIEITNDVKVYHQKLNVLLGFADDKVFQPELSITEIAKNVQLEEALHTAHERAYQEKISEVHVAEAETQLALTKSNRSFKLGVVGSFQFSNPQIFLYPYNLDWYSLGIVGLRASYGISNLYHHKNKVAASKIQVQAAHIQHHQVSDKVRTAVYQAYFAWDEAKAYEGIYKANLSYAEENKRIIKNGYFSNTVLITDYLDANMLVLKAQFDFKQAQINILKTYLELQYAQGLL